MITITHIDKQTFKYAKPVIAAVASVIFNSVAMITTIKATVESTRIIDEKKETGELSTKSVITDIAPKYVLPASCFMAGQILSVGSALMSREQMLGLSSAVAATSYRYHQYREKNKELYGDAVDDRVLIELSKDATSKYVDYSNCPGNSIDNVDGEYVFNDNPVYYAPEGKLLFFDELRVGQPTKNGYPDDGFFVCTVNQFQQARLHLNRAFTINGFVDVNRFYENLGIPTTIIGNELTWDASEGYLFIDIGLKPFQIDEGITAYRLDYEWLPEQWHDVEDSPRL